MRIVFFGSDEFAATHLEQLLKSNHKIIGCVTQPDRAQGRGMKLVLSPIKVLAAQHNIDYFQPEILKEASVAQRLKAMNADIFVVVAYGQILTQQMLNIPKLFCVNVHGSLLPKYRGAAPINWAILNGDTQTGVSVQKIALALDAGDIIAQSKMNIAPDMTADVLRTQMAQVGAKLLVETLDNIEKGKYKLTPQDPAAVTVAPKLTKDMGKIDWTKSAQQIYNQIRGLKPWPGTYTQHNGKMIKIIDAELRHCEEAKPTKQSKEDCFPPLLKLRRTRASLAMTKEKPGKIIDAGKQGFTVACGQGALLITQVQPEAGKIMPAASFIAGHKLDFFI